MTLFSSYQKCTTIKRKNIKKNIFDDPNLKINTKLAKEMVKNNEFDRIIDVRNDRRWIMGHHVDAIHIQLNRLESILPDKIVDKNFKLLVYAENKQKARDASKIIKKLGYKNIKYINENYTELYP
jgi:rhodanese-related sulfurtransferase